MSRFAGMNRLNRSGPLAESFDSFGSVLNTKGRLLPFFSKAMTTTRRLAVWLTARRRAPGHPEVGWPNVHVNLKLLKETRFRQIA